uniref:Family with sequence similarity 110 member C n=1 Tax=Nothobranchius furzeri TaxID=105023 RepID=A0A8C6LGI0_NOTFU
METNSGATRILGKGPEYLRKQMERESEPKGRVSAVERLAASKPKYVKSQQVVSSTQESAISSASVSGAESSNHNHVGTPLSGMDRSSSKKRRDSLQLYRQKCDLLQGAENDRKRLVSRRLQLISVNKGVPLPESLEKECESESNRKKMITPEETAKECGSRVVINQPEERSNGVLEESSDKCSNSGTAGGLLAVPDTERSGAKIGRSHSDISSRYSKSFADFDVFFKYCGLDGEVVESLGRENFSARSDEISINIRSVSISTSDDNFSKDSGDSDGLLQDELLKKKQQGTSVIERNARIIKWLYSCKNATETGKNQT